jgi:hypothetical protein
MTSFVRGLGTLSGAFKAGLGVPSALQNGAMLDLLSSGRMGVRQYGVKIANAVSMSGERRRDAAISGLRGAEFGASIALATDTFGSPKAESGLGIFSTFVNTISAGLGVVRAYASHKRAGVARQTWAEIRGLLSNPAELGRTPKHLLGGFISAVNYAHRKNCGNRFIKSLYVFGDLIGLAGSLAAAASPAAPAAPAVGQVLSGISSTPIWLFPAARKIYKYFWPGQGSALVSKRAQAVTTLKVLYDMALREIRAGKPLRPGSLLKINYDFVRNLHIVRAGSENTDYPEFMQRGVMKYRGSTYLWGYRFKGL